MKIQTLNTKRTVMYSYRTNSASLGLDRLEIAEIQVCEIHFPLLVRGLRGRKHHNCSFCDKRTIFTGSSPFDMTIHIRYGGISEINPDSRKCKIS